MYTVIHKVCSHSKVVADNALYLGGLVETLTHR